VKQPKFKFGDRVKNPVSGKEFIVKTIHCGKSGYSYSGEAFGEYRHEDALDLYQEPQGKKLYAYKFRDNLGVKVEFYMDKLDPKIYGEPIDIEYPAKDLPNHPDWTGDTQFQGPLNEN
jgi:hypothetical protein